MSFVFGDNLDTDYNFNVLHFHSFLATISDSFRTIGSCHLKNTVLQDTSVIVGTAKRYFTGGPNQPF